MGAPTADDDSATNRAGLQIPKTTMPGIANPSDQPIPIPPIAHPPTQTQSHQIVGVPLKWASLTITIPAAHPLDDTHYYNLASAINPQRGCFPFLAPGYGKEAKPICLPGVRKARTQPSPPFCPVPTARGRKGERVLPAIHYPTNLALGR